MLELQSSKLRCQTQAPNSQEYVCCIPKPGHKRGTATAIFEARQERSRHDPPRRDAKTACYTLRNSSVSEKESGSMKPDDSDLYLSHVLMRYITCRSLRQKQCDVFRELNIINSRAHSIRTSAMPDLLRYYRSHIIGSLLMRHLLHYLLCRAMKLASATWINEEYSSISYRLSLCRSAIVRERCTQPIILEVSTRDEQSPAGVHCRCMSWDTFRDNTNQTYLIKSIHCFWNGQSSNPMLIDVKKSLLTLK